VSGRDEIEGIGSVLRGALDQPKLRRGLALGHLARRWDEVVGDKLAAETWPLHLEGRTLVVAASSQAWATQAGFLADRIARRAAQVSRSDDIEAARIVVRPDQGKPQVRRGTKG
jgi:predicted nucleic acid-binding Zn ribbon protein